MIWQTPVGKTRRAFIFHERRLIVQKNHKCDNVTEAPTKTEYTIDMIKAQINSYQKVKVHDVKQKGGLSNVCHEYGCQAV